MATKKEAAKEAVFSKQQFLTAKRYAGKQDLLNALLDDDKQYTIEQVNNMLEKFLKGKV